MNIQEYFNQKKIIELSFFNFENAITAAYFANEKLEVQKVNKNFENFFPVLGNVTNAYFPHILEQLGVSSEQINQFKDEIDTKGKVLIPGTRAFFKSGYLSRFLKSLIFFLETTSK